MIKCVNDNCSYYKQFGECSSVCINNGYKKNITNFDTVNSMSLEEFAEWAIYELPKIEKSYTDSRLGLVKWLESEVIDNG